MFNEYCYGNVESMFCTNRSVPLWRLVPSHPYEIMSRNPRQRKSWHSQNRYRYHQSPIYLLHTPYSDMCGGYVVGRYIPVHFYLSHILRNVYPVFLLPYLKGVTHRTWTHGNRYHLPVLGVNRALQHVRQLAGHCHTPVHFEHDHGLVTGARVCVCVCVCMCTRVQRPEPSSCYNRARARRCCIFPCQFLNGTSSEISDWGSLTAGNML